MPPGIDAQVASLKPHVERLARPFVGVGGAEFDDLVQEGLIAVWQSLAKGIKPTDALIRKRMRGWIRKLNSPIPYDELLPLEAVERE